jgi:AraC-like DNA-binding protein
MNGKQLNRYADMVLVCNGDRRYGGEITLTDNVLVGVLAGELKVVQANRARYAAAGDTLLLPRNQPALVQAYYTQHRLAPTQPAAPEPLLFPGNPLLQSLFASLLPYLELQQPLPEKLFSVKLTEALEILRSLNPHSDRVLANFAEPGKVNLVDFMEANYLFNLPLTTFSYLTGRSLTTFKRDFKKAFQLSPQRWLTHKRLMLAHYQLTTTSRKPVELYLEVGFENLAHFSFAFKKQFGYSPTALVGPRATSLPAAG